MSSGGLLAGVTMSGPRACGWDASSPGTPTHVPKARLSLRRASDIFTDNVESGCIVMSQTRSR
jgi:hypothetical protein